MSDDLPGPWNALRQLTAARIGLKRSGASLATAPLLEFQLAHARARDAVHQALDEARLEKDLMALGLPVLTIASQANDRAQFLMRPDLGRQLSSEAERALAAKKGAYDIAFVISDGLSAGAAQKHAAPLLAEIIPALKDWRIAPLVIVRLGRVGAGDAVAAALNATCVVILLGERPGPHRAGQPRRLSHLEAAARHDRSGSQLRLQHPPRGRQICRCGADNRAPAARHARRRRVGHRAQGRLRIGCW